MMRWLLALLLLTTAAHAAEWRADDGSTISIYGCPTCEDWEAYLGDVVCTPTGGPDGKKLMVLYCDGGPSTGEKLTPDRAGIRFHGKLYREAR